MKPTKKSDDDSLLQYPNEMMKIPALRRSKYYINIGSFWHHSNCGSTRPSMAVSKENKLSPSFSGFKSQKFIHESSHDGVSGTDNGEGLDGVNWQLTNGQNFNWQLTNSLFLSQKSEIFTLSWPRFPEKSRRLPIEYFRRISEDLQTLPKINCPQIFRKTFEQFRTFLKKDNFSVFLFR